LLHWFGLKATITLVRDPSDSKEKDQVSREQYGSSSSDHSDVKGDRGTRDRKRRGRQVYGRREKRGREAGFPGWREGREIHVGKSYATLCNKKGQRGGSQ